MSLTSSTRCVSHPDGLSDLFLDRSLGRKKVPELLRAEGLRLLRWPSTTVSDETIEDTEWLQLCGEGLRLQLVFLVRPRREGGYGCRRRADGDIRLCRESRKRRVVDRAWRDYRKSFGRRWT